VVEAGNGEEALAALERHPGRVDALVTDLQMPGMGGRELADRMRAERPGMNVVFISGFTEAAARLAGSLRPGESFLEKPFSAGALLRRVREATGEK
jgi:CheY-like chemotaxis protein